MKQENPLSAALAAPIEKDVTVTRTRHQPGSISSSVAALGVGSSFFYNVQVPECTTAAALHETMVEMKAKLRKNASGIVDKTAKLTGQLYTTVSDHFMASDGAIFVMVRITRTA